jgi:hypothetical protein
MRKHRNPQARNAPIFLESRPGRKQVA